MENFRVNRLGEIPPVVKNLLIINVLAFFLSSFYNLDSACNIFGLHYFNSPYFHWWQLITHMFMHGGYMHIFFNMFALWMFGRILENVWGSKRFLFFYLVCGLGAAFVQLFVNYLEFSSIQSHIQAFANTPSADLYSSMIKKYFGLVVDSNSTFISQWSSNPTDPGFIKIAIDSLNQSFDKLVNIPTVGASGAIFGLLLGYGMLFPNTQLMLLFPPIPIKAKWLVIGYGAIELYQGLTEAGSDIAHFAHLGGMLFGFILIRYWSARRTNFY